MAFVGDLQSRARRFGAPFTIFLIVSLVGTSLYWWGARLAGLEQVMLGHDWPNRPWSVLTFPWAYFPYGNGLTLICFAMLMIWLYWAGAMVERAMGTARYAALWFGSTILSGVFFWGAGKAVGVPFLYGGPWMPEAAITVWWCMNNKDARLMLYGMIPVSGVILAWITAGTLVLLHGAMHPVIGFASVLHLIPVYFLATGKIPMPAVRQRPHVNEANLKKSERMGKNYYDDVKKREKDREERERLRKLFESSIDDNAGNDH